MYIINCPAGSTNSIQNYQAETRTCIKVYFPLLIHLNLEYVPELFPQTDTSASQNASAQAAQPPQKVAAAEGLNWRTLCSEQPRSRGCGSHTLGLAHHASQNPLGKGHQEPAEGPLPYGQARVNSVLCLRYNICKILNRETAPAGNTTSSFAAIASGVKDNSLNFVSWSIPRREMY